MRRAAERSVAEAFEKQPELENLLLAEAVQEELAKRQAAWRRIVSLTVVAGFTAPLSSAALEYVDGYRCSRSPGALVQCLRDALHGAGFERLDKQRGEFFNCRWSK